MRNDKQEQAIRSSAAEYLTFVAATGDSTESMEMRYEDENIWLTQKMMSALYDVDVRTINEHIQKIYEDGELTEEATIRNFRIVQTEGSRQVTRDTKDYTIKGWVIDDERLKRGTYLTEKYFDEQLECIREIRASERKHHSHLRHFAANAGNLDMRFMIWI